MALLLGRGDRPGRLVRPARRALARGRSSRAHERGRPLSAGALAGRPRAAADRRPGRSRSGSSCSSGRPRCSATPTRSGTSRRRGSTSSSGSALPVALGPLRRRLACPLPLARDRRRVRLGARARWARGAAARRLPRAARAVARRCRAARVHLARARLLRPREPPGAGVRDRAVHLCRALRDGGVRPRHVGASTAKAFAVVFALLRAASPRSSRVDGRDPRALAVHRAGRRRAGARARWRSSPCCSARSCSTATAGRRRGRTCGARRRAVHRRPARPSASCSSRSLSLGGLLAAVLLVALAVRGRVRGCPLDGQRARAGSTATSCSRSCRSRSSIWSRTTSRSSRCRASSRSRSSPTRSARAGISSGRPTSSPNLAVVLAEHDLVRPGRRARRRARRGSRDRARSCGDDLPRPPRRASLAVRDAGADGALHGRRPVDPLARLIAHHLSGLSVALEAASSSSARRASAGSGSASGVAGSTGRGACPRCATER